MEKHPEKRRLAAILVADVAGFSRQMESNESGTLARLKGHREELIYPTIAECEGRVVKTTGDGFLAEFASVLNAVRCAALVQGAMWQRNTGVAEDLRIQFRMGINQGDVIVDGDDLYGDGINVAARLEAMAQPGGICVSGRVHEDVGDTLGLEFDDLGENKLKNIERPIRVFSVRVARAAEAASEGSSDVFDDAVGEIITLIREEWGRALATLVGYVRDFELAEDVLQDAVVIALRHWPEHGVPDHPRAWLIQTARRKAIDRFRRDRNFETKRAELKVLVELDSEAGDEEVDESIPDERLRLIFTCCHPALAEEARVALTLQTLTGLTTTEIARAFLVPEATMAQRLVRAKRKIKAANIPYRIPPPHLWAERFDSVLSVIYLIFNEGCAATSGPELTRADLCHEAIRLAQTLASLVPRESEAAGLLALLLLHDSRRRARTDRAGNLVPLEEQDRRLWDQDRIKAGDSLLRKALGLGRIGPYQVQAAISGVHALAPSYAETDWAEIMLLYDKLYELQPSRVVELNAIVARSFAKGVDDGLAALDELAAHGGLERYQPFHAARADLLRRAGRNAEAAGSYRRALELTHNDAEQRFLEQRLHDVSDPAVRAGD